MFGFSKKKKVVNEEMLAGMVVNRKFARKAMKREIGRNKIQSTWSNFQKKRYGYHDWVNARIKCDTGKRQANTVLFNIS